MCDRCQQKTRSTKKLTVQRFPRILVLRILIFKFCFFHPFFFSFPMFAEAGYWQLNFLRKTPCLPCSGYSLGEGSGQHSRPQSPRSPRPRPLSLLLNQSLDLNRFSASRGSIKKSSVGVDFPLQRLSLGDFASDQAGESGGEALGAPEGSGRGPSGERLPRLCLRRKPRLPAVRPVQPLGQRPLRPLHGPVPLPDGLARLQRLSVSQPWSPGPLRLFPPSRGPGRPCGRKDGRE